MTRSTRSTVTRLLDEFGYDAVDVGPLKDSWRIQRDTPGYGPRRNAEELRRDHFAPLQLYLKKPM